MSDWEDSDNDSPKAKAAPAPKADVADDWDDDDEPATKPIASSAWDDDWDDDEDDAPPKSAAKAATSSSPKKDKDWDEESDDEAPVPVPEPKKEKSAASQPKKEKKEVKPAIIYQDEFDNFHLKTQADCEEMCNIVIEKLETAGKKGHMRGCEVRFALAAMKGIGSSLTMKELEALKTKLAEAQKQKKVQAAEKLQKTRENNEGKHAGMVKNTGNAQAYLDERYAYDDDDADDDDYQQVVGDYDEAGDYVEGYYQGEKWIETKRYKAGTFDPADFA